MKTILDILERAGGWRPSLYLSIPNPPYLELVIEAVSKPQTMPTTTKCSPIGNGANCSS